MVKIDGKVNSGPSPSSNPSLLIDQCFTKCFDDVKCVLAEFKDGICFTYDFTPGAIPIEIVRADDEGYVAFKSSVPNNVCPATFDGVSLAFPDENGNSHPWIPKESPWRFAVCREGWKRFDRPTLSVCIMATSSKIFVSKEFVISFCKEKRSELIGVQTVEEAEWMRDQIRNLSGNSQIGYWTDGVRIGEERTVFEYSDNMTIGNGVLNSAIGDLSGKSGRGEDEPCLCVVSKVDKTVRMNDVKCDYEKVNGGFCGYRLL